MTKFEWVLVILTITAASAIWWAGRVHAQQQPVPPEQCPYGCVTVDGKVIPFDKPPHPGQPQSLVAAFDVPPKEWESLNLEGPPWHEHHRVCQESLGRPLSSLVMLKTEDGKWHCLKLVP